MSQQKRKLWYSLETPYWGASKEHQQYMFSWKNKLLIWGSILIWDYESTYSVSGQWRHCSDCAGWWMSCPDSVCRLIFAVYICHKVCFFLIWWTKWISFMNAIVLKWCDIFVIIAQDKGFFLSKSIDIFLWKHILGVLMKPFSHADQTRSTLFAILFWFLTDIPICKNGHVRVIQWWKSPFHKLRV